MVSAAVVALTKRSISGLKNRTKVNNQKDWNARPIAFSYRPYPSNVHPGRANFRLSRVAHLAVTLDRYRARLWINKELRAVLDSCTANGPKTRVGRQSQPRCRRPSRKKHLRVRNASDASSN